MTDTFFNFQNVFFHCHNNTVTITQSAEGTDTCYTPAQSVFLYVTSVDMRSLADFLLDRAVALEHVRNERHLPELLKRDIDYLIDDLRNPQGDWTSFADAVYTHLGASDVELASSAFRDKLKQITFPPLPPLP